MLLGWYSVACMQAKSICICTCDGIKAGSTLAMQASMQAMSCKMYGLSWLSRLTVVSREAKKKQHACTYSGPRDHYSELFTRMAALKF